MENERYCYKIEIKKYKSEDGGERYELSSPDCDLQAGQTIEDLAMAIVNVGCITQIPPKDVYRAVKTIIKTCDVDVRDKDGQPVEI